MNQNLVIVESPAKAKTIEKFLGEDYKVLSSYGHIRDLKKKSFSVDVDTFAPQYEVPADKFKVVAQLKKMASEAQTVWLASDEDREGEAISWHLAEVLELQPENTRRIVFHEITKPAILEAIEHPREIDLNLVNAQQARRVLDRIVGFKLSPVLWRKVKPNLSAGRVQSVAVRLIVEREREIQRFEGEDSYRVTAVFQTEQGQELKAELNKRFSTMQAAEDFLKQCAKAKFCIQDISTKPLKRMPAPPFTTSTLQQEAAHKLGFTVAQTMMIAQHLYESGRITYMRTDSVNLSKLCLGASKQVIAEQMGKEYVKTRQYQTHSKGAQEAHEAIRPTYMEQMQIEGTSQEKRLYDLIWKRTLASQMADAEIEKTQAVISVSGAEECFVASGEVVKFDGFLRVYKETQQDEENMNEENASILPAISVGETLERCQVAATQRFAQRPLRYNEASLVRKLEELGIGRPSTYASTITTIQQRDYVMKGDKPGEELTYQTLVLSGEDIVAQTNKTTIGAERGKLMPTDVGVVVNDFLQANFPEIMDYNFTAEVEKQFDDIAEGKAEWVQMIRTFYNEFDPLVEAADKARAKHKVGERQLGNDPASGMPVTVKIGRFGPVVQIGSADGNEKPRFAQLKTGQTMDSLTLEEALELFRLPRTVGEFEGKPVVIGAGRFGPYVSHNGAYVSIPKGMDPLKITFEESVIMIHRKRREENEKHLKQFEEDRELEVLKGPYGPYIAFKGVNYRLPKALHERAKELTYEECMVVVEEQNAKAGTEKPAGKRKYSHRAAK
ncbi:MAG: type I DNA topoisomerase [Bacteroidaceae bacterium]|nr:type I DNA topoisomerase [Bacteroidaceae bacterium]